MESNQEPVPPVDPARLAFGSNFTPLRVLAACGLGMLVLGLSGITMGIALQGRQDLLERMPWLSGVLNHVPMLVYSLLLMTALSRGRLDTYGLRWPDSISLGAAVLLPAAASVLASGSERLFHLEGLPFMKFYSLGQTVLLIWILASTAEEFLTRGLIQGFLQPLRNRGLTIGGLRLSVPVLTSGLFFGAMHLMLLTMKVQTATVISIVLFALAVGLIAGYCREKSGSILPAILAHACANVTGTLIDLILPR